MQQDDDDEDRAWRSIVENYGDRPDLDEPPPSTAPFGGRFGDLLADDGVEPGADPGAEEEADARVAEEGFVPPPPPPLPHVAPDRMLAWVGIFGSPAVLLAALVFSISLPPVIGYLLVGGFVGGFVYLVLKMPRGPRDPWDDGAQV